MYSIVDGGIEKHENLHEKNWRYIKTIDHLRSFTFLRRRTCLSRDIHKFQKGKYITCVVGFIAVGPSNLIFAIIFCLITLQLGIKSNMIPICESLIVFDRFVDLLIWLPKSCSTDGVKNASLISHLIKFRLVNHRHKSDKWSKIFFGFYYYNKIFLILFLLFHYSNLT